MMNRIDVQEQPVLSFRRIVRIAFSGVRYRLFRATITVAVIAIAMAFLMNILSESLIKKSVAASARDQIEELHRTDTWIARLSVPRTPEEIIFDQARHAPAAETYLQFFNSLDYGRRRILTGSAESTQIFDLLQEPEKQDAFFAALANMKAIRLPNGRDEFVAFLASWPELKQHIREVREKEQAAIDRIEKARGESSILQALTHANGDFGKAMNEAGFAIGEQEADALAAQARDIMDSQLIEDTINHPDIRQAVAAKKDMLPGDITVSIIWKMLRDRNVAVWYLDQMSAAGLDVSGMDADRVLNLAGRRARAKLLVKAELLTADTGGGLMGIGQRMTWLALVSMLVCVVGIANAMLMSVTERFREIATLKCLGALNTFIMTVFLIESSILGLAGGIAGTLIGLILCVARMLIVFQSLLAHAFPWGSLGLGALISIAAGILLAAVAAVYPSLRAARLAPMEAMRIE
ncbi:MAG: ABC transporter permease [Kiritimatiellia bacterium]